MRFENPWLLAGMAAAAIPVIIHLINRRRARLRPFAAMEFLLLSDKRIARRLKLRQLLVLALRVLLLVAIPFALAKPYLAPDATSRVALSAPGSVVLVVDDSMSMSARGEDGRPLLEAAVAEARRLVASGGSRTSFAVVAAGAPARLLTPALTYDRTTLERALTRLTPGPRASDLPGALREAERLLASSAEARRQVVVLGDQARHAWSDVAEPWALARIPAAEVIDVRGGRPIDNLAITQVALRPALEAGPGQVQVEVSVANHGLAAAETQVTVDLAGQQVVGTARVPPAATEKVAFTLRLDPGSAGDRGTARLSGDALPDDDVWYFAADFGGQANVLVVNGSPSNVPYQDELFFLRPALQPGDEPARGIVPTFVGTSELTRRPLEAYDVVVLANVGSLTSTQRALLEGFVEAGGGLLVTGGDQLTPDSSATFGALLPFPVRDIKTVARRDDPAAAVQTLAIANVDFEHPVMAEFEHLEDASLFRSRIYSYALLDTRHREGARVLASFSGGIPALVEAPHGRGRVMMLTTTADRDWSDLCIRTSYLPLMQQLVRYLGGTLEREGRLANTVGDVVTVAVPEGTGPLVLDRPDGAEVPLGEPEAADARELPIPDVDVAGHYTVRRAGSAHGARTIAVNGPRTESDLSLADLPRVHAALERPGSAVAPPEAEAIAEATPAEDPSRTRLWPAVLVALFGLLASEAWLVVRG